MPGKFDINPQTGKQYGVNPATGVQDDNYWANTVEPQLKGQYGGGQSASGGNYAGQALDLMKQAQQFQVQQNQPAIQTLQNQYNPETKTGSLKDQYDALLADIKGQGQTTLNSLTNDVTREQSNLLASRGIVGGDLADRTINSALQQQIAPISSQFQSLYGQTGVEEGKTLNDIAAQIAGLQAGNVPQAQNFGANIAGVNAGLAGILAQVNQPRTIGLNQQIVDPLTGKVIGGYGSPGNTTNTGGNPTPNPSPSRTILPSPTPSMPSWLQGQQGQVSGANLGGILGAFGLRPTG